MNSQRQLLDVSWEGILKIFLIGFLFYCLYLVRDIVVWFIFALIISVLLNPAINLLKRLRVPRFLAVVFVYLAIFGALGFIIYLTAPMFIFEIQQFTQLLPQYFGKISPLFEEMGIEALGNLETFTSALIGSLEKVSSGIFSAIAVFFGGVYSSIFILTIAFFLSLEEKVVERALVLFSPKRYEDYVLALFKRCQAKISGWFGTRILACLFIGVASFVIFLLFDIKYTFILALLAGVLNFIPYLGPLVTAVLLFGFITLIDSWLKAVFVLIAFYVIQQIEGNLLTPILAKKFIGLPPVLVLVSLVIGGKIFGLLGAIFAIPVAGILYEFLRVFLEKRKEEKAQIL